MHKSIPITPDRNLFEDWLSTRPPAIRDIARRFPPGTTFNVDGSIAHVIEYLEDGGLMVTDTDPSIDYSKAFAERYALCFSCVKDVPAREI